MTLKVGDVDLLEEGINNEYKVLQLEKLFNLIIAKANIIVTEQEMNTIRDEALQILQNRYPKMGIIKAVNSFLTKEEKNGRYN